MGFKKNLFCAGAFALGALAAPLPDCPDRAPATDASTAATALTKAFNTYNITHMQSSPIFESGHFKYNKNHYLSLPTSGADAVSPRRPHDLVAVLPVQRRRGASAVQLECADASTAATALTKAFNTYNITSKGEQAAIIAYELFESGDFKYNKNHYPGRPGQGTRMMAMPNYVEKYATSVAGADAVSKAKAAGGDAGLVAVLALVNSDDRQCSLAAAGPCCSQAERFPC
ncbi:hypothetical protein BM1_01103 [Bipolaris maydis]|nr:hypothetical protein BM1_01103 [Bipolaris maydis]